MKKLFAQIAIAAALVFSLSPTALAATTTTIASRTIAGNFFSPSVVVPVANTVIITATMTDSVYFDLTKSFTMTFQFSLDNGLTWRDDVGCGWSGIPAPFTDPGGNLNPRLSCRTNVSELAGALGRLHIVTPTSIVMGATITLQ